MEMDLKAIEERNQMCLDQAIDEGWDEGDIARILFDEDVPALVARVKELESALRFYADPQTYGIHGGSNLRILQDAGRRAMAALQKRNPTESDKPSDTARTEGRQAP